MKSFFHSFEQRVNRVLGAFRSALGLKRPQVVIPYLSYGRCDGAHTSVRVMGRVVEEAKRFEFSPSTGGLSHFLQVIRLFLTPKVPHARVLATLKGHPFSLRCNEEGFFSEVLKIEEKSEEEKLQALSVSFSVSGQTERSFPAEFLTPTEETHCLLISDVDDTVIKSRATNFLRLAFNTLFYPVEKRKTFVEASRVYQALKKGKDHKAQNLLFYVSSSSWNLYPLLQGFLELNKFPAGPLILQDHASERKKDPQDNHTHKLDRVLEIAALYPEYPLILLGDAGQRDPFLYLEAAKQLPGRVKVILIRRSWWTGKTKDTQALQEEALHLGVALIYFEDLSQLKDELKEFMRLDEIPL